MSKIKRFVLLALLPFVALTGCATLYQRESTFSNGYSDYRVAEDQFVVTFRANEFTPPERVMQFVLKRAAQLTLRHQFRYFVILDRSDLGKNLHYPSLRISIQCFQDPPAGHEAIEAAQFIDQHKGK